jgi:hypothetical protein
MIDSWEKKEFGPALLSLQWNSSNVFPNYLHWLQYRKVLTVSEFPKPSSQSDYADLIKFYCWGSYIEDEIYQDMVVSAIIERLASSNERDRRNFLATFGPNFVSGIYQNTTTDSPLRRLIIYALTCIATEKDWARFGELKGFPSEFLIKIAASTGKALAKETTAATRSTPRLKELNTVDTRIVRFSEAKAPLTFTKATAEETECTYHHHVRSGLFCWRKMDEFSK